MNVKSYNFPRSHPVPRKKKPKFWQPGEVIVASDGKQYRVSDDGSWCKLPGLATPAEVRQLQLEGKKGAVS